MPDRTATGAFYLRRLHCPKCCRYAVVGIAGRTKRSSSIHRMKCSAGLPKTNEGYSVNCPGLPGCWSRDQSEKEALQNIKDAIADYLAALQDLTSGDEVREVVA